MANEVYVPDANVFIEYIYSRLLQKNARQLVEDAILDKIQLIRHYIDFIPLGA